MAKSCAPQTEEDDVPFDWGSQQPQAAAVKPTNAPDLPADKPSKTDEEKRTLAESEKKEDAAAGSSSQASKVDEKIEKSEPVPCKREDNKPKEVKKSETKESKSCIIL